MNTDSASQEVILPAGPDITLTESEVTTSERSHPDEALTTKISWKVIDYGGPPYFHLYVTLNDEEDYYAGYFWGENFEIAELRDTPDHALMSAIAIWTGVGEQFYIYQKNETELTLMNRHMPYGTQPEEREAYQEILTIPVDKGSKLEVGDVVHVNEPYAWSQDYSFILYDSYVLGGLDRSGTLTPISEGDLRTYRDAEKDWGFRLFQDEQYLESISYYGFDSKWLHDIVTEGYDHTNLDDMLVELEYKGERFDGLAINDGVPLTFGSKIQLDPNVSVYVDAIAEILADHGLEEEPVHIREIVQTDLEGDGVDEVLIVASNIDCSDKLKGQYSIVVLRKLIDGKVESIFLKKQIKNMLPTDLHERLIYDYELREIVDFDHDGVCELLIAKTYYEGRFYLVYKLVDGEMQLILESGFGV